MGNFSPIQFNSLWLQRLEPAARAEFSSLQEESDPQLYAEGVLGLAQRQEQSGHAEFAVEIYQALLQGEAVSGTPRARAQLRLDALTGRGDFGNRAEVLLRNLAREAADPSTLAAMGAAGAVFRMARLATLSRLTATSNPGFLTRFVGAGRLASLAGFALEAPTFTLTARLGNEAVGRTQDWSLHGLGRDVASSYLVLGGLKLAGSAGTGAGSWLGAGQRMEAVFRQSSSFLGILIGHRLEQWAGLRRPQDGATTLVDSLALLLQFHVAGRLSGAAFGENFQRWERGMDLQAEALSQASTLSLARPSLSLVPAEEGPLRLPNSFAMSINSKGDDTGEGRPIGGSTMIPADRIIPDTKPVTASSDPVGEFRSTVIPRLWTSKTSVGPGTRVWGYELVLQDLENLLQAGASRVIARRNGQDMVLKLVDTSISSEANPFVPPGLQGYDFWIQEGEHLGKVSIYVEPTQLHLFSMYNSEGTQNRPELLPGAGTMVMDWIATQAALRGQGLNFLAIKNPRTFHILSQRPFFHPQANFVEACLFRGKGHRVVGMAHLSNTEFQARHWGSGFFNIRGRPNPELLPAELRSLGVHRSFGISPTTGEPQYPYQLVIEPFRDFLQTGFSGVIAQREGKELRWTTRSIVVADRKGEFLEQGGVVLTGQLHETGMEASGEMKIYLHPGRFEVFSLSTKSLTPGAGTIALDWASTQAAVKRLSLGFLYIENSRVLRILARSALLGSETRVLEAYRHSQGFYTQDVGSLEDFPNLRLNPFADFYVVQGPPNQALLPAELQNLPKY